MLLISWREAESNLRKGYAPISEDIGEGKSCSSLAPHERNEATGSIKECDEYTIKILSKNGNESSNVCENVYVCQVI